MSTHPNTDDDQVKRNTADANLLAAMVEELRAREAPIEVVLTPLNALHLAGLLQLALRHPSARRQPYNQGIAEVFVAHVRAYFADAPATLEVLRRGDDSAEDLAPTFHRCSDDVIDAMETLGGQFVSGLGGLYRRADASNQAKLRAAFAAYFAEYTELARLTRERAARRAPPP